MPDNATVLVITQPQVDLLPGEVDKMMRYVDRGGNLLWLVDPDPCTDWSPWPKSSTCSSRPAS